VDAVSRFYATTEAGRLRTKYFQAAGQERLNHVVRSRVDWVANYVAGARPDNVRLLDVGTLYPSFLAELRNQGVAGACDSLDPPEGLETDARAAGAQVGTPPTIASVDVVTAFEQLEHQSDPGAFLRRLKGVLKPGGWLFATTRSISGLDLQVLWDKAPYIFVPEHLNLLSVEGLTTLFEAAGFAIVELSTPGQLDVELIERSAQDFDIPLPRMLRYLFRHRGDECRADLQELLQRHRLSSHVRIAARVPTA
jgi:SAM-dependent methyltransferase